jgi:tetratricopeptide (TPR) repeat protein
MASTGASSRPPRRSYRRHHALGLTFLALAAACSSDESRESSAATTANESAQSAAERSKPEAERPSSGIADSPESTTTPQPIPTTVWSAAFATWTDRLQRLAPDDEAGRGEFRRWLADLAADLHARAESASTPAFHIDATTLGQACQLAEQVLMDDPVPLEALTQWLSCVPESGPSNLAAYHSYLLAFLSVSRGAYQLASDSLVGIELRFPTEPYLLEERWTALAQVHRELGARREAQLVVAKLIDRLRITGKADSEGFARALAVRADIAMELGRMDRALADLDEARKVSLALENRDLEFEIFLSMLDALLAQGRCERVVRLTAAATDRSPAEAAQIHVSRGAALLHLGRSDPRYLVEAATTLDAALECATLPPEFRAFAVNRRIEVALAKGAVAEAITILTRHSPDRAALLDRFRHDRATVPQFDLVSLMSEIEIAKGQDADFAQLELHRDAFQCLLRSWRALGLDTEGIGRMHLAWPNRLITGLMRLEIAAAEGALGSTSAVEVLLQAHAAFGLADAIPGPMVSLARFREALPAEHGILAIQASPTGSLAIWLEAADVAVFDLPGSQAVEGLARELNRQLDEVGVDPTAVHGSLEALEAALLPTELRRRVEQARLLTIACADLLGSPPFEVLSHSAGGSLGERLAIDRTTSLVAWHRLRSRDSQLRDAVFVGSLSPSSRHRGVEGERTGAIPTDYSRQILAAWPNRAAQIFVDQAATVESFQLAASRPARFLHILGHGVWEAESDVGAVIALTPSSAHRDGVISEREIRALPSCPPVIMLSSCRIGATKQRIGDSDLNSLGGAFLRRGARSVVQSRFPLQIGHHSRFAARVHASLAAGATAAEAVRQARHDFAQRSRSPDVLREIAMEVIGHGH